VACDPETDPAGYLVFSVFFSDHLERSEDSIDEHLVVCAGWMLDEYPELGHAFDLAKRGRSVSSDWVPARC